MNEKMNGGISTMRGIFCRLSFQKGGITAETIAAQGFDGGIFYVDTRQTEYPLGYSVFYFPNCSVIVVRKRAVFAYFRFYVDSWGREKTHLVRITHPRRDGTGEVSFITGWMVEPGGKLRMTTPYGGKSYARNG